MLPDQDFWQSGARDVCCPVAIPVFRVEFEVEFLCTAGRTARDLSVLSSNAWMSAAAASSLARRDSELRGTLTKAGDALYIAQVQIGVDVR